MTDHAGPRRSECPPGIQLWRPPARLCNPVLAPEERIWRPLPCLSWKWFKLLFCYTLFPLDDFYIFGLIKTKTSVKPAPWATQLGYKGGRVPQLCVLGNSLRWGPAWICRLQIKFIIIINSKNILQRFQLKNRLQQKKFING